MNLDAKVGRDTIFLAHENEPMSGFFSKFKKKLKKVTRKIGKAVVPKKIYKKLSSIESKNRKGIKKLGAVAAVAAGAYFAGPTIYKYAASKLGGKSVVGSALKSFGGSKVRKQATNYLRSKAKSKILSTGAGIATGALVSGSTPQVKAQAAIQYAMNKRIPSQRDQQAFQHQMNQLRPDQVLRHPIVADIGQDVAAYQARKQYPRQRQAAQIIAREGAYEVEHQVEKKEGPDYIKYAIPAGAALLVALITKG